MISEVHIKFPVLMLIDGTLYADSGVAYHAMGVKFISSRKLVCEESIKVRKHTAGWIIDKRGVYIKLTPSGKRREWLRFLSFIWMFVQSEYDVSAPRDITILEAKRLIFSAPKAVQRKSLARDFLKFLERYNPEEILTEDKLSSWPL